MSPSLPDDLRRGLRGVRNGAARLLADPPPGSAGPGRSAGSRAPAGPAPADGVAAPDPAAAARARFRADVAELLETSLDQRATLDGIVNLAVPDLAELCVLDLVDDEGRLRGSGVASALDPALAEQLLTLRATSPLDPAGPHPIAIAARTGRVQYIARTTPEQLRAFAADDRHFQGMTELGYTSAINAPLLARGRTLGVLSLLHLDDRSYSPEDVEVVVEVAGKAALALDNARLFAELSAVRAQQEAILAGMTQSVTAEDRAGRIVFANHAAIAALGAGSLEELRRWTPDDIAARIPVTDPDGRAIPMDAFPAARIFAGQPARPLLVRRILPDTGEVRWAQVAGTAVRDQHGEVVLAVTVSDDVTAVKRAEAAQRFLASASKLLGSSLDVETTLGRAAATAVPQLADWCRVDILDDHDRLVPAALAHPQNAPDEHVQLARTTGRLPRSDPRSPWTVIQDGRPFLINDVPTEMRAAGLGDEHQQELANLLGLRSLAVVPLTAGARIVGLLTLATTADASGRRIDDAALDLAMELGRRAGMAVEHARVHATSRHIAETLQRSLLPRRLPDIPGTTMAPRFRAAGEGASVGGDFYDAFPAHGGWMVVMGDVAGKGPAAAAVTAQARDTMRTAAAYEVGPAAVLARLNATLTEDESPQALCSALAVLLEPPGPDGAIHATVCCAGHPRPYLLAGGDARLLGEYGSLLGAFDEGTWPEVEIDLHEGDALVLYTDGVTDARGEHDRFGRDRLAALLREEVGRPAHLVAARIDETVARFEQGPQLDDLAVLVVQAVSRRLREGRPVPG